MPHRSLCSTGKTSFIKIAAGGTSDLATGCLEHGVGWREHNVVGFKNPLARPDGRYAAVALFKSGNFRADPNRRPFRFGLGSDFWVTDHWGIRLEGRYLLPATRGLEDLDTAAALAGIFYRF